MGYADPYAQRQPFTVRVRAHPIMDKPLRHMPSQCAAVISINNIEHHVEGTHTPGTGKAIAIDDVQISAKGNVRKCLMKAGMTLPVDRAVVAVQKTSMCKYETSVGNGT